MIPVFVLDNPDSISTLQKLKYYKGEFVILTHTYTSDNFKRQFQDLSDFKIGSPDIYKKDNMDYYKLFDEYEKMGANYGIIKYYYIDSKKTLESAKEGLEIYKNGNYHFKLMGIAQGNTVSEYVINYKNQKSLGFDIVAIGGLSDKNGTFLKNVIHAIGVLYPDDDILLLGYKPDVDKCNNSFQKTVMNIKNLLKYLNENHHSSRKNANSILLLVSSTNRKSSNSGKAINVYTGQYFRIIRKQYNKNIDIKIISAKYGLIDVNDEIDPYYYKLKEEDAKIYKQIYKKDLEDLFSKYSKIAFCGWKLYSSIMPENNVYIIKGGIFTQSHLLKEWMQNNTKADLALK